MVLFPEYLSSHRYLLELVKCDLGCLCSALQFIVCHFVRFLYCHCIVCPSSIYPLAIFKLFLDIQISGIGNFGNKTCVYILIYIVFVLLSIQFSVPCFVDLCFYCCYFLLAIVQNAPLKLTASECLFGIHKIVLQ